MSAERKLDIQRVSKEATTLSMLTMVWMLPMHSKVKSKPPSVISVSTCRAGRSWSLGLKNSVAPNSSAGEENREWSISAD